MREKTIYEKIAEKYNTTPEAVSYTHLAPLIGNIFVIINKTCCIKDDVVMDMIFINRVP